MKRYPYIDRVLPADADEEAVWRFYTLIYPTMKGDEKDFAREVLLAHENLPDVVREELA